MNPSTGDIYRGKPDIEAAIERGEEVIELTEQQYEKLRDMNRHDRRAHLKEMRRSANNPNFTKRGKR